MSVVLNALRAKEAARTAARPSVRAQEGLFIANDMPRTSRNAKRLGVLLACLFLAIAFATFRLSALYFSALPQMPIAKTQLAQVAAAVPALNAASPVTAEQAKALFSEGRLDESLAAFESLAKMNPKDASLRNNMALILMKQERSLEAENRLREAVAINPDCAECYNTLGLLATQKGYSMQAERHFMKAMDLNDDYAEPYFNLAVLLEKNGDEAGAIAHFEDFLKHTKNRESAIARQVKRHLQKLNS
jgi:Flp pilus assembly protein TadD